MAGIGFELRKLLRKDSFVGLLEAYGYAGLISSGPWILSIVGVLAVGLLSLRTGQETELALSSLWVSITYLIAGSLILTGFLQLSFTRFVADRTYERKDHTIFPNLMGALTLTMLVAGAIGGLVFGLFFDESFVYRVLMTSSFVVLSGIWMVVIFVSGMKEYRRILGCFLAGYATMVALSYLLEPLGLEGLLGAFFTGHVILFFALLALVARDYPGDRLVDFTFLRRGQSFRSLALTGFLYNLGIWGDKLVFWWCPSTSSETIGPLRASTIYDLPVFLAYLSIVPGMAVFILRIETDFAECYDRFFRAVREGGTLAEIRALKRGMVVAIRRGFEEIYKVQGLTVAVLVIFGPGLLRHFGASEVHARIFAVDVVGVAGLVLLLAVLNVFFYLDQRRTALSLTALFAVLNLAASLASIELGPSFYGYGFLLATFSAAIAGIIVLHGTLEDLEYETFMLRT